MLLSGYTGSCRTRATAAKCWPNPAASGDRRSGDEISGERLIERERALADGSLPAVRDLKEEARLERRGLRRRVVKAFVLGVLAGCVILIAAALLFGSKP